MRLSSAEGELDLVIAGYQLDEGEHGDGFNCLNVDGIVRHPRGNWSFRGKFCSISDLAALADWLDAVAAGQKPAVASVGGFMSAALSFAVSGSERLLVWGHDPVVVPPSPGVLRVTFGDTTHPPWDYLEWVSMDFALTELDLRAMAADLRERLRTHPPR